VPKRRSVDVTSARVLKGTAHRVRNSPITVRETLSGNPEGTEMIVNTTMRVEHGYGRPGAGESKPPNVSTVTTVFRKQQ
jgi:hypothetical protein